MKDLRIEPDDDRSGVFVFPAAEMRRIGDIF